MKKFMILALLLTITLSGLLYGTDVRIDGFCFACEVKEFGIPIENKVTDIMAAYKAVPNQVLLGHSQGGLKALGYAKMEKAQANLEKRPSNIKAFISVDSPVTGFTGLDYGYDVMRTRVLSALGVHTRAVGSSIAVLPLVGFLGNAYSLLPTTAQLNLVMLMTKDMPLAPLIDIVINKSSAEASAIQQITDMSRLSPYMAAYVGPTTLSKVRYIASYRSYLATEWRTGLFGIKYLVIVTRTEPVYAYYDRYDFAPNFRSDIPIGHIVGTDKDPLRMALDKEGSTRFIKDCITVGYSVAGSFNTALAITTFPLGTAYYTYHAVNCFAGVAWSIDYVSNWGTIIGGQASDAFITQASQVLPGTPGDQVRHLQVDHNRSTHDPRIWDGPYCLISQLKTKLGVNNL